MVTSLTPGWAMPVQDSRRLHSTRTRVTRPALFISVSVSIQFPPRRGVSKALAARKFVLGVRARGRRIIAIEQVILGQTDVLGA